MRRDHHDHRQAIVARSAAEAAQQLERSAGASGRVVPGRTHTLVFVFGARDDGEAADRDLLARCAGSVESLGGAAFACQVDLAEQLRELGVVADEFAGIGTGAITAQYVSGSIDPDERLRDCAAASRPTR